MKKLNIFLGIVLGVLVILVAYFFIGGTLGASVSTASALATDQADAYASIQNILSSDSAPQQFADAPDSADDCTLIDVTITLKNRGMFPAEWISMSVTPASGDIAVYSLTGEGSNIASYSAGQVNLKLITTTPTETRTITIQYYVFGMLRSITVTI